jgi:hypothetical protein
VIQDEVSDTCTTCTLTLAFSSAIKTFGFEAEPDPFPSTHTINATFLNGASTVGTISRTFATGNMAARLFGATTTDQQFTSVVITIDGTDFALAQFRYSAQAVPEPGSMLLLAAGLGSLAFIRKFRRG